MPSVSSAYIQSTVSYLVSSGVATDKLSLLTQKHSSLADSSRISMEVYVELLNQGAALTNSSLFGFELGKQIQARDYGVLGYLVESCENLAQAISALTRFDALVADIGTTSVFFESEDARVEWVPKSEDCRQMVLRNTTAWVATVYKILGAASQLNAVTFTFPLSMSEKDTLAQWFGCEVVDCAQANTITFPQQLLYVPFTSENKAMFSALVKLTEEELSQSTEEKSVEANKSNINRNAHENISNKVVALLKANTTLKGCDQKRMAEALFISPRTLQRKLKQSNTSFKQILDTERKARLDDLLMRHTIADTASLLGFKEQSSFTHVFKTWFSTTPLKYQKKLKSNG
ncbi:AraC family transcriptional regulator [Alteromonas sp. ALT199]|uniref:AraC family transcriptional regulator n=1 Tax=unclassified Alteromonas TaxID=2614992 RepID=UPI000452CB85|nr:AraC family transcriptional regulator [Alteromonas sp. ALT199]